MRWQPPQRLLYEGSQVVQTFRYFMPDLSAEVQVGHFFELTSAVEAAQDLWSCAGVLLDAAIFTSCECFAVGRIGCRDSFPKTHNAFVDVLKSNGRR